MIIFFASMLFLIEIVIIIFGRHIFTFSNRELCIYDYGVIGPRHTYNYEKLFDLKDRFTRKKIPFSEISEIHLNTKGITFVNYIEFQLKNQEKIKYHKYQISDWKEFYRGMLYEINDKVKVVE